jgi:hypothetical protein
LNARHSSWGYTPLRRRRYPQTAMAAMRHSRPNPPSSKAPPLVGRSMCGIGLML